MQHRLIFQITLGISISVPTYIFSSTVQAHSICKNLGQQLDPTMRCSHTHFAGRTTAPEPAGYFDNGSTVFYANYNRRVYCSFASPKHLQFFQSVIPAKSAGRQNPSGYGKYAGTCDLPSGYFDDGASVFLSAGNGTFCGFPNPQALTSHQSSSPKMPSFGRIDIKPKTLWSIRVFVDREGAV